MMVKRKNYEINESEKLKIIKKRETKKEKLPPFAGLHDFGGVVDRSHDFLWFYYFLDGLLSWMFISCSLLLAAFFVSAVHDLL